MFSDLKSLIAKNIQKSPIYRQIEAAQVVELFDRLAKEILPGHASDKVKGLYVKNKVLHVASLSSLVAQELKFKETEIINAINESLGREMVNRIRYVI